jgi:cytochrome c peroxidase
VFRDLGRFVWTGKEEDQGAFKTPTLRDVARTAPYMHDGSLRTLEEVVAFYDRGGNPNPALDPALQPLSLDDEEKADLVAFLEALNGDWREEDYTSGAGDSDPGEQ